jgi:3-hydroxybutyryl-CoA dehydratase
MTESYLSKRFPTSWDVGTSTSFSRTITEADVALFIGVTWDVNPYHTDDSFARKTSFKKRSFQHS